ncbi:MAG TPA: NAD-dependent epimerase/dehydratase family protein, partial [Verrucomicrobiae bacterium]|jgi:UDP-glucose 4-epimerase|nr:NAD-dependent epimerase/dehydratase family protein [Verrucomicrobiae bacterium]
LREGWAVTVVDDCSTGSPANLRRVQHHPNLTMLQCRVSDCAELPELCGRASFIFHLAAAVGVELVVHSPIRTIETNLQESEVILLAASKNKTPILFTSTSEVYGKSSKPGFSEEDDLLIGPPYLGRWSYACSKLMDEFLALAYYRELSLPVIIVRLFNTVGPRQTGRYGMVVPRFVSAALANQPLQVYGSGDQTRCFCHVHDTVEALFRLMQNKTAFGRIFNIGSTEEISIRRLAERIIAVLGSKSRIEFIPYQEAYMPGFEDMLRRKPIIEKLGQTTGFTPGIGLQEIISSIATEMRQQPTQQTGGDDVRGL